MKRKLISFLASLALVASPMVTSAVTAAASPAANIESGIIYRLKNVGSGKYLTVAGGRDADDVNVIQKTNDGSLSQQFRLVYNSANDAYQLYPACSANGYGRAVTAVTPLGAEAGCNVVLRTPSSDGNNTYWKVKADKYYQTNQQVLTLSGTSLTLSANAGEGSQYETSAGSAGNVILNTASNAGKWVLEPVNPTSHITPGNYAIRNKAGGYLAYYEGNGGLKMTDTLDGGYTTWQVLYMGNGIYHFRTSASTYSRMELQCFESSISLDPMVTYNDFMIISNDRFTYRIVSNPNSKSSCICAMQKSDTKITAGEYAEKDEQSWYFEAV